MSSFHSLNPNSLANLAKNLPESAKVKHFSWNWDTGPHVKYPRLGYYSTESIKIQQTLMLEFEWFRVVRGNYSLDTPSSD